MSLAFKAPDWALPPAQMGAPLSQGRAPLQAPLSLTCIIISSNLSSMQQHTGIPKSQKLITPLPCFTNHPQGRCQMCSLAWEARRGLALMTHEYKHLQMPHALPSPAALPARNTLHFLVYTPPENHLLQGALLISSVFPKT